MSFTQFGGVPSFILDHELLQRRRTAFRIDLRIGAYFLKALNEQRLSFCEPDPAAQVFVKTQLRLRERSECRAIDVGSLLVALTRLNGIERLKRRD